MEEKNMKKELLLTELQQVCGRMFGCPLEEATEKQAYKTVCTYLRETLAQKRRDFQKEIRERERKQVYYMPSACLPSRARRSCRVSGTPW